VEQNKPAQAFYQPSAQQLVQPLTSGNPANSILGLDLQNNQFWKGALIGAAVTLLVTNESVQKGVVKAFAKLTATAQSGIEEMKEKFEDAKAEAIAEVGKE
jgi:hypothetical protein